MCKNRICIIIFIAFLLVSCSFRSHEEKMKLLAKRYQDGAITNAQMLLEMGEIFHRNPSNEIIREDYFSRMIISGFSSWVLHYYLSHQDHIPTSKDEMIILFAINKSGLFHMAGNFIDLFSTENTEKINDLIQKEQMLESLNNLLSNSRDPDLFARRAEFFFNSGLDEMGNHDLLLSSEIEPCNENVVYQMSLILMNREELGEIISLLDKCPEVGKKSEWRNVFYNLALEVKRVSLSDSSKPEKTFQVARLYANRGFLEIAFRKTQELIQIQPQHADHLALHAFVLYKMGDKKNALFYVSQADDLSGKRSRLKDLIEEMP